MRPICAYMKKAGCKSAGERRDQSGGVTLTDNLAAKCRQAPNKPLDDLRMVTLLDKPRLKTGHYTGDATGVKVFASRW